MGRALNEAQNIILGSLAAAGAGYFGVMTLDYLTQQGIPDDLYKAATTGGFVLVLGVTALNKVGRLGPKRKRQRFANFANTKRVMGFTLAHKPEVPTTEDNFIYRHDRLPAEVPEWKYRHFLKVGCLRQRQAFWGERAYSAWMEGERVRMVAANAILSRNYYLNLRPRYDRPTYEACVQLAIYGDVLINRQAGFSGMFVRDSWEWCAAKTREKWGRG